VSLPAGNSLNENIDKSKLEKVTMSSAKLFSYSILEAGAGCKMGKFDLEDAYKNVPVPISELNLQGFSWLGRYFVELKQMFGTVSSVQNFDVIGNTLKAISLAECKIPRRWVHRQLDDVPYISRANSQDGTSFESIYRKNCKTIGIALAKDCPSFDKAFSNSTHGKVLGIIFDTTSLSWRLSEEKIQKYKNLIATLYNKKRVSLFDLQNLLGCLNHITQMCPFLLCFRFNILKCLKNLENDSNKLVDIIPKALSEMLVWWGFLNDASPWIPICNPPNHPPICTKVFTSDAAGLPCSSSWVGNIGCGVIGINEKGSVCLITQLWWPKAFITSQKDSKGKRFGNKTATLELVGIILPFLLIPESMQNQHVIFKTDNLSCVFGHQNGYMKGDECASILLRSLYVISAFLGCTAHIEHIPRRSDWESEVADNLSREKTTGFMERQLMAKNLKNEFPQALLDWLDNAREDWSLPLRLLDHVKYKCSVC
jgi:hypothetical protein